MIDNTGRWVLVTGASRGIGEQMALELARHGVNVVAHSRDLAHTQKLVEQLQALGVKAYAVAADLADAAAVRAMADEILARTQIDLLFNDAGVQPRPRPADSWFALDADEYLKTYGVNVVAPMILIEKFLPGMIERGFGRVTNTTSGIADQPEQGAYAASKGGLNKITKDFASKFEDNGQYADLDIMVNVSDPGWIRTDLGGPNAPNAVETVVPGMVVGGFVDSAVNGRWINAQDFSSLSLEEAVGQALQKAPRLAVTE